MYPRHHAAGAAAGFFDGGQIKMQNGQAMFQGRLLVRGEGVPGAAGQGEKGAVFARHLQRIAREFCATWSWVREMTRRPWSSIAA